MLAAARVEILVDVRRPAGIAVLKVGRGYAPDTACTFGTPSVGGVAPTYYLLKESSREV